MAVLGNEYTWLLWSTLHRCLTDGICIQAWEFQASLSNCLPDISGCFKATSNPLCPKLILVPKPGPFPFSPRTLNNTTTHSVQHIRSWGVILTPLSPISWMFSHEVLLISPFKYFSNLSTSSRISTITSVLASTISCIRSCNSPLIHLPMKVDPDCP